MGLAASFLVASAALASGADAPEVQVVVRAAEPAAAACRLADAEGAAAPARLLEAEAGRWRWSRRPGDVLSCSSPGHEPVDVDSGRGARLAEAEVVVELLPARTVTLSAGWGGIDALVEWRTLGGDGGSRLARERHRIDSGLRLPVAHRARVLRFRPEGSSPVSVFVPEGAAGLAVGLPPPRPGGEVFGVLPGLAFPPAALELRRGGRTVTLEPDAWGVFRAGGLLAGSWTLVPRYRGGVAGKARPVVVESGRTRDLVPLSLPELGAARVTAPPEACGPEQLPARLVLRSVGGRGPSPLLEATVSAARCDWELEGLEEGTVEALLVRSGETPDVLASHRWDVLAGEKVAVELLPPAVLVRGRLTFGGERPAAGLLLTFRHEERDWSTETGEDGGYALTLGEAGDYTVAARTGTGLPAATFALRLPRGESRADFELADTAVTVRVGRRDGAPVAEPVQLVLTSETGRRVATALDPGEEGEARLVGLDLGVYWAGATTPSGLASDTAARVELTAELPFAEIDLVLDRHDGRLSVVDELGLPVAAQVVAGERLLPSRGGGGYALATVPVGERLEVLAPGYVPVCRVVQPSDLPEMRVVLPRPTEQLILRVPTETAWGGSRLVGLPGSDCPVALTDLEFSEQPGSEGTTIVVRVPRGRFQLALAGASYAVVAPGGETRVPAGP